MLKNYYNKRKQTILPFIKDFTKPGPKKYAAANVNDLTWKEWFWLHPTAYNIINYGNNTLNITMYTTAIILINSSIIRIILAILILINIRDLIKKLELRKIHKNMTFYELYLRE